jgi:two-component sensor histidine kinase
MQMIALPLLLAALMCLAIWSAATNDDIKRAQLLVGAGIVSLGLCALQWRFFLRNAAQDRRHQQYLKALERLSEIAAAIRARIDSQTDVLNDLAEAARDLLSMDRSGVVLLEQGGQSIRVVASAGNMPERSPVQFNLLDLPLCRRVLESGRPAFLEDARDDASGINLQVIESFNARCVVLLPLVIGDRRMGFLALSNSDPHVFDDGERRLAELLGRTASVILSNSELYTRMATALADQQQLLGQTSRDAQTKAMLLRELNHRVKNNLASIITLLSLDEPELSAPARRWLDRVIDRIRAMAHAHQLFTGSPEGVSLSVLAQRTISSLSVVLPNSAAIHTEVPSDVKLGTEQAVSVAMVLHELCYNAIVHGLGGQPGTVTIRGGIHRGNNGDSTNRTAVVLEVIDTADGQEIPAMEVAVNQAGQLPIPASDYTVHSLDWLKDAGNPSTAGGNAPAHQSGLGLVLVDGLVTRELGGAFSLHRTSGGTLARIWFPITLDD